MSNSFRVGMALNNIAIALDEYTLSRIKPYLDEIEEVFLDMEGENNGSKELSGESKKD